MSTSKTKQNQTRFKIKSHNFKLPTESCTWEGIIPHASTVWRLAGKQLCTRLPEDPSGQEVGHEPAKWKRPRSSMLVRKSILAGLGRWSFFSLLSPGRTTARVLGQGISSIIWKRHEHMAAGPVQDNEDDED